MTTQIVSAIAAPTDEPAPHLTPAAGPTARLEGLPQPRGGLLSTPSGVDEHLAQLEMCARHSSTRSQEPHTTYGTCVSCKSSIHPERLDLRPWLITCTECAPPGVEARAG